jgi:hypothetical protein
VAYERLRAQYLHGDSTPSGIGSIVFHGLLRGIEILLTQLPEPVTPAPRATPLGTVTADPALVRVLANMVLQVHSMEVCHVY